MTKTLKKYILFACLVSVFVLGFADQAFADNIFGTIVTKAGNMLKDLKIIVYILGGFGILAVSFMALFGKMSWQRFSYIAFGLFLVAGMGSFIDYFVTKKGDGSEQPLTYGNHLSSLFADTAGTSDQPGGTGLKPPSDGGEGTGTTPPGGKSCTDGTTNESGQTCVGGQWVTKTAKAEVTETEDENTTSCSAEKPCEEGKTCVDGQCVTKTAEADATETEVKNTTSCSAEKPCEEGKTCVDGQCVTAEKVDEAEEPQVNEARRCESDKQCKEKAKAGEVNEYQTICYNNICMSKAEKEETKKAEKEAEKEAKIQKEKEEAEKEKEKYTCQSNDDCLAKIESKTIDAKKTQCYQNQCMTEKAAKKAAEEEKERKKHACESDADCASKAKEGVIKSSKIVCHEGQCTSKAGAYLDNYTDQVVKSGEGIMGDIAEGAVNTAQGSWTGLVEAIGDAASYQLTGTIREGAGALNEGIEDVLGGTVVGDVLADIATSAVSGAATEINNETSHIVAAGEDWVEDQTSFTDYSGQNDLIVDYIENEIEKEEARKQKEKEEAEAKAKAEEAEAKARKSDMLIKFRNRQTPPNGTSATLKPVGRPVGRQTFAMPQ